MTFTEYVGVDIAVEASASESFESPLIDMATACRLLSCGEGRVRLLIRDGHLKSIRHHPKGKYWFRLLEVESASTLLKIKGKLARGVNALSPISNKLCLSFGSVKSAVTQGFSEFGIRQCLAGIQKTSGGFIWKYADS